MKKMSALLSLILTICLVCSSSLACTAIYVGADNMEDGSVVFGRAEDFGVNSYNKLQMVIEPGVHKAGEEYVGCYGFVYTFEKDSYGYTAFCDDNGAGVDGVCPDCGETHAHTPYQAAGTNEMGVSVTATETLGYDAEIVQGVDPFEDTGIEEAEITTVILSQAATAKEGVDIILGIYDKYGCCDGAGIFVADDKEVWYIENVSGHQYVALKLPAGMVFSEPNMSIIGLIDLDDENVIGSPNLIAVAQEAGTFVGNADENIIDYVASYSTTQSSSQRMIDALNYFAGEDKWSADNLPVETDYAISNLDADGNIVPLYTNITLTKKYSIADVQNYYHLIPSIGKAGNLQVSLFQIAGEDSKTDTVEWVNVDDAGYGVFVPYYPMLTTEVYAPLSLSTATATFSVEKPAEGLCYPTKQRIPTEEGPKSVEGFKVYPANWADGYYWSMDALSNLIHYAGVSEEKAAAAKDAMMALQAEVNTAWTAVKADVAAASDADASAIATAASMGYAQQVHTLALELINGIIAE